MSFSIQFINLLDSISETRANEVRRTLLHKTSLSSVNTFYWGNEFLHGPALFGELVTVMRGLEQLGCRCFT